MIRGTGWFRESYRHSLAAKGISTSKLTRNSFVAKWKQFPAFATENEEFKKSYSNERLNKLAENTNLSPKLLMKIEDELGFKIVGIGHYTARPLTVWEDGELDTEEYYLYDEEDLETDARDSVRDLIESDPESYSGYLENNLEWSDVGQFAREEARNWWDGADDEDIVDYANMRDEYDELIARRDELDSREDTLTEAEIAEFDSIPRKISKLMEDAKEAAIDRKESEYIDEMERQGPLEYLKEFGYNTHDILTSSLVDIDYSGAVDDYMNVNRSSEILGYEESWDFYVDNKSYVVVKKS